jgi:predicted transcriptional regulator
MSQIPIDQRNALNTRAALWSAMRELGSFTVTELAHSTRYNTSTVQTYLQGLEAAGFLTSDPQTKPRKYTLPAPELIASAPPRVRKDGSIVTQGQGRKNLWRTMRILGEFSVAELRVFACTDTVQIKDNEASDYVHYLVKAGYLVVVTAAKAGKSRARYRFVMSRYTGPLAPQIQRVKQVWDPNTQTVVWGGKDGK